MAPGGAGLVALAAQRHAVPFVVLVGLYKLSPLFPHDPALTFNEFRVRRRLRPAVAALQCRAVHHLTQALLGHPSAWQV